ncbi:hypothetical protein G9A89_004417 [Geosiphon pyriformis]|nr:hypothetical protein G9A89_004417 [Geosiphon pyriformis]
MQSKFLNSNKSTKRTTQTKILIPEAHPILQKLEDAAYYSYIAYCSRNEKKMDIENITDIFINNNEIIITFHTPFDFLEENKERRLVPFPDGGPDTKVDFSFFETFKKIETSLFISISEDLDINVNIQKILFTGHEIGGVLAVFSALGFKKFQSGSNPIKYRPQIKVEVVTFGQLRIGNFYFAKYVEKTLTLLEKNSENEYLVSIPALYRVTYSSNLISQFPIQNGKLGYFHHSIEYWIEGETNDCNCLFYPRVYECHGVMKPAGYLDEPEDCNKHAMLTQYKRKKENGPYFEYIMGEFFIEKIQGNHDAKEF